MTTSPPPAAAWVRPWYRPRLALGVHLASLAVAFAALMHLTRNIWFFADDWDFLARRRQGTTVGIWVPHNEHWSTLPILVYRALYDAVGLRSYRPYLAVLVLLHVLLAHLLWRWMRRSGADPWVATALAALFLVLGGGYECLVYPFTMSYTGALVLGFAALLLVDHEGGFGARDLAAWAVAVGALMCSGIGVTMVVVMGAAVLLRRGLRAAVVTVSVPALAYLLWFLAVGRGSTIPASKAQLLMIPAFVWTGLSHAAESAAGMPGAGPVLVLALVAMLLRQRGAVRHRAAVAAAAALGAVAFLALAGVGRIALGVDLATIPRYTYVTCALLLVAAGAVLTELGRASGAAAVVVLVAVGAGTLQGAGQLLDGARSRVAFLHPFQDTILAAAWMVESRAQLVAAPDALPEPKWSPDLTLAGLRQLVDEGAFGAVAPPSATARLAAALQLQVVTGDVAAVNGPPPRLSSTPADSRGGTGCAHLHEDGPVTIRLFFRAPAAVSITPVASGQLTLAMATTADPNLLSAQRSFPLTAGHSTVLSIAAADAAPVLTLPAGDDLVCGLQL